MEILSKQVLSYKGYVAKIEFSAEDKCWHGKIDGITDLVTFEADNAREIEKEFRSAVDDYLNFAERTVENNGVKNEQRLRV